MAVKHKTLYLYLALACFLGIILIFIFDGYIGLYDKLSMDNGQYTQSVEADQWSQQEKYGYLQSINVDRGSRVDFTYELDNRRFSGYAADVEVSLWHNQEKLADVKAETLSVASFGNEKLEWSLDAAEIVPADYPTDQTYNVNVVVKRGVIERKIVVYVNPSPYPAKVIPVPPR